MITKEEAYNKIKNYLDKNIKYSSIDNINNIKFTSKDEMIYPISYGKYKGKRINYYAISYGEIWRIEERSMGILIHAETGVLLYIITPHGYLDIE
ncbi:hypothetical protein ATB99_12800 [Elizabethkingia meningoseptica]|uniref:hypothetical protein n=1 Tax=Elizabethkingia meningoseptica TaxID=238 RepID=UPI000332C5EE|nr:hypothetical protein [Elizabethkingia meningoseptica]AQX04022.1 hypothetical protein BBD33_01610 [Elizabethkingia meningoseptica]AQX46063.1 hypothetical protein B5G46_01605 [Elizabethkingia meningoseptica]EOR30437.1 hypothetical protein L100_05795 [Elizabethkingia meningoseptica ATCC 13253 = NBRC 12535]KUY15355.1 hypothetical protein ATB99_12800 [Elizabethkingia meningoseptica]MDE5488832.1 hypothetical protein [Elizabethkingia meningoseptica]